MAGESRRPGCSLAADLVHELIRLGSVLTGCPSNESKVVLCEVANCLGDIGAVDLSTVALGCTKKPGSLKIAPEFSLLVSIDYAGNSLRGHEKEYFSSKEIGLQLVLVF